MGFDLGVQLLVDYVTVVAFFQDDNQGKEFAVGFLVIFVRLLFLAYPSGGEGPLLGQATVVMDLPA